MPIREIKFPFEKKRRKDIYFSGQSDRLVNRITRMMMGIYLLF